MKPEDYERLKDSITKSFLEGTEAVADDIKRARMAERLKTLQEGAKVAAETIDMAKELAADGDPHKRRIAEAISNAVAGGVEQMPNERAAGGQLDASPFSENSSESAKALPSSTPSLPPQPKKRGRPPKPRS